MVERIVIDTSVWVAALKSAAGGSRKVIRLCLKHKCQPIVGQALLTEYEELMARPAMFANSPLSKDEREELLDAFLSVSEWVPIFFLWRPNLPDEHDNHLIELAVAGAATTIITFNRRDLSGGELKFPKLDIFTPATFLRNWRDHGDDDDSHSRQQT
jgi:putative PIN family toxin of toxin-antitoxin system